MILYKYMIHWKAGAKPLNNKNSVSYLMAVAGAYLIYLGAKQFIALFDGTASIPVLNAICGVVFVLFGGAVLYREWRNYRRASQNVDPGEAETHEEITEGEDEA